MTGVSHHARPLEPSSGVPFSVLIYSQCSVLIPTNSRTLHHARSAVTPPLLPQSLATTSLLSVSEDLPVGDIVYEWPHTPCGPLRLTPFASPGILKAQPRHSLGPCLLLLLATHILLQGCAIVWLLWATLEKELS